MTELPAPMIWLTISRMGRVRELEYARARPSLPLVCTESSLIIAEFSIIRKRLFLDPAMKKNRKNRPNTVIQGSVLNRFAFKLNQTSLFKVYIRGYFDRSAASATCYNQIATSRPSLPLVAHALHVLNEKRIETLP